MDTGDDELLTVTSINTDGFVRVSEVETAMGEVCELDSSTCTPETGSLMTWETGATSMIVFVGILWWLSDEWS